ncbi:sensor histidine kinase [Aurantivibrio infirmus]
MRSLEAGGGFLPDLCKVQSVFTLIIGGELLAVALVLADVGVYPVDWQQLGAVSFMVQWIILLSAALLCPLRSYLGRHSLPFAGSMSFGLVLVVTLFVSVLGEWVSRSDEFDYWQILTNLLLAAIFAGIVLRYFYIQQQLLEQEEAELKARIQALQSRIRPHFLFNCMNSIVSLIGSDPERAEHVVEDLSDLFRASLAEPGLVPVGHELALCKQYISIEQLRLGPRLKMDWQVGSFPSETKIPSLLLQPIIENAIYHGIQPRVDGGTVEISVQATENLLTIAVRNPLPQGAEQTSKPGNRVALDNIRHRLAAYYGDAASFIAGPRDENYISEIRYPMS